MPFVLPDRTDIHRALVENRELLGHEMAHGQETLLDA